MTGLGSSPRARGTPAAPCPASPGRRFIPASAGNTSHTLSSITRTAVHPRERGEHLGAERCRIGADGSSPRARGTHQAGRYQPAEERFIPASAGNTSPTPTRTTPATVHPRERGEHLPPCQKVPPASGSSPRARGTLRLLVADFHVARFIPASAGNTTSHAWPGCRRSVHPRERGEHARHSPALSMPAGSSPRARGTPGGALECGQVIRFIPASAGNTWRISASVRITPVHPRERGEHEGGLDGRGEMGGSSPRARGTRGEAADGREHRRFIPASAGNTQPPGGCRAGWSVHPRERGEHRP